MAGRFRTVSGLMDQSSLSHIRLYNLFDAKFNLLHILMTDLYGLAENSLLLHNSAAGSSPGNIVSWKWFTFKPHGLHQKGDMERSHDETPDFQLTAGVSLVSKLASSHRSKKKDSLLFTEQDQGSRRTNEQAKSPVSEGNSITAPWREACFGIMPCHSGLDILHLWAGRSPWRALLNQILK
ncbi:hypothetical protein Mapa_012550 [Marchantia paleacea]|nr:hypothetical protein Mapa_012550 [Marchantia paleacea]